MSKQQTEVTRAQELERLWEERALALGLATACRKDWEQTATDYAEAVVGGLVTPSADARFVEAFRLHIMTSQRLMEADLHWKAVAHADDLAQAPCLTPAVCQVAKLDGHDLCAPCRARAEACCG